MRPAPTPGPADYTSAALLAQPAVQARLQARQAFADLRVDLPTAQAGSRGWLLRAVPCEDELGAFGGFTGLARPMDDADNARTDAAALQPLLGLHTEPALLAVDHGTGWQVQHCNAAAGAQWPGLTTGSALPAALGELPAEVAAAFERPAAVACEGWRVQPCSPLPGRLRGLVLGKALPAPVASAKTLAPAPTDDAHAESDNFSFTVSHDLRAPIRVVEGFTRIVKEDYGRLLDRVGNDHLDRVLGAAARMRRLFKDLLRITGVVKQKPARNKF